LNQKIIPFSRINGKVCEKQVCPKTDVEANTYGEHHDYVDQLMDLGSKLKKVAELFDIPTKEALIDFTYIFVGDEIADSLTESGEGSKDD